MKNIILVLLLSLAACASQDFRAREGGAVAGGLAGAGLGAIVGHKTGSTGAGIAIGSAMGAISGGLIGNQIDNTNDRISAKETQIRDREAQIQENQNILNELKSRGADVYSSDRGIVVSLPDVLFAFNSDRLGLDAQHAVREIAQVVSKYPERRISVEGHTDSVGGVAYNKDLSQRRANSVVSELTIHGVSRSRISSYGYGEGVPIASNSSEYGRARNRRVEVIILN